MHHNDPMRLPAAERAKLVPARPRGADIAAASGRPSEPVIVPRARVPRAVRHLSGYARA
jgi:hypothetical protein